MVCEKISQNIFTKYKYKQSTRFSILFIIFLSYIKTFTIDIETTNKNFTLKNLRRTQDSNVYGSAFGLYYYYGHLYLGPNMKKQSYILDTGSTITTSPCQPLCTDCGKHFNSYYVLSSKNQVLSCESEMCDLVKSFCNKNNECSFNSHYTEGSTLNGFFVNESVKFCENYQNQNETYIPIGCTTYENNLFYTQEADGIMGLANSNENIITVMYKLGAVKHNIYSLCLSQIGGYFSIGEINNTFHKTNIKYFMLNSNYFYNIDILNIYINNKTVTKYDSIINSNIIDSGTTISYFPKIIFEQMENFIKTICNNYENKKACGKYEYDDSYGACFIFENNLQLINAIKNYWPIITFEIYDYNYEWKPENYFFNMSNEKIIKGCMGFNKEKSSNRLTLGSTWMIGHDIIFDRENKKIGFVEAFCDKKNKNLSNIGVDISDNNEINNKKKSILDFLSSNKMLNVFIFTGIVIFCVIICLLIICIKKLRGEKINFFGTKQYHIIESSDIVIKRTPIPETDKTIELPSLSSDGLINQKYFDL